MKRIFIFLMLASVVVFTTLQAQTLSTSRLEKQRGPTRFQEKHLKQSEASLLLALDSTWQGDQQAALQTVRYLEQMFPSYSFSSLIKPLDRILRDETADPIARRLAALALDELHSDAGDAVIEAVGITCSDTGLRTLCKALQVGSDRWKDLGSKE
jgi:hypothetical protein